MSDGRYLKDKAWLYLPFFGAVMLISLAILLMPYETLYVQDRAYLHFFLVTIVLSVAVFFIGTLYNVLIWMQGKGLSGSPERRLLRLLGRSIRFVLSGRLAKAIVVFVKDAIYLSKLKGRSKLRWLMHILILGGFTLTFLLDIIVTVSMDILKYQPMIDENGWAKMWIRDFGFEVGGLMMLLGLTIAAVRRFIFRPTIVRTELPDAVSILFLLFVVLGGFILEGIGIVGSIPYHTTNQEYSFVGYAFSLITPSSLGQYFDQAWLVHGVMSALFIAYIPFSKLFHMIATPIAIEAERLLPSGATSR